MSDATEKKITRTLIGQVIKNKMNKTVVVSVARKVKHELYGKFITRTTKLHVHDENNVCNIGDTVKIEETKPISKLKAWKLVDVLTKAV